MSNTFFDRYKSFKDNGSMKPIPGIKISPKQTDKKVVYKKNRTRLDKLSFEYYNNPTYGFLIMLANQKFGGLEFNIKDGEVIRIPYPLETTLEQYNSEVKKHFRLYGE